MMWLGLIKEVVGGWVGMKKVNLATYSGHH